MSCLRPRIWTGRCAAVTALVVAAVSLTCAGAGPERGGPAPEPDVPATPRDAEARALFDSARVAFGDSSFAVIDSLADAITTEYPETRVVSDALLLGARASLELNRNAAARRRLSRYLRMYRASDPERADGLIMLARILHQEGRPVEAADSLLATSVELDRRPEARREAARTARRVVGELGAGELAAVMERWPASHPLRSVFAVERASLLLAAGEAEAARRLAEGALELAPLAPEETRARAVISGEMEGPQWRPLLGAILPLSGPLAPYGRLVEEGIRLAVEEYNRRHVDSVTLIIKDDGDNPSRDGPLVRELDREGAVAVIGPLRSEGLDRAAEERRDRNLLMISPTAPENVGYQDNVYTLWSTTDRAARGARALARFAVRDLQLYRFGVMYPNTRAGRAQLASFADAARAAGAEIAATVAYEDTATNFQNPMSFLAQADPQAIFAPGSSAQSVIQMAPQFSFWGLRGIQVLGDAQWAEPEVLRLVEPRFINGTILSTFLHRSSASVRWPEFVEMYERRYRKGLEDSLVPALAYDATRLILEALPWGYPRRRAVARSFREIEGIPGATGIFSVEGNSVMRRPFILQIGDRELVPAFELVRAERSSGSGGRDR